MNNDMMLPVGAMLRGIYRVDRKLASGGFGNTYAVTHVEFNVVYAVKEFFIKGINERGSDHTSVLVSNEMNKRQYDEQLQKFKKEARRLWQLHNEHIVKVYDLFEENGTCYYVMDYIEGESLAERIKRTGKPMEEAEVRSILAQVLDALAEVHNASLWHLDLKPANIMYSYNGEAVLIDFGASKQLSPDGGATMSTALCYTPGYAPLEQVEQNLARFGPWTDLYALGATLFHLLTAQRPPLPGDIGDNAQEAFAPLAKCSQDMREIVAWMMQLDRRGRPQSVKDVQTRLSGDDTIIADPPAPVRPSLLPKVIIGILAVAAAVAAVVFLLPSKMEEAPELEPTLEMEVDGYLERPDLDTPLDTFAYAIGLAQSQGLADYLQQNQGIDTTFKSEIAQGMLQGAMLSATPPEQMETAQREAYNSGIQIGTQVKGSMLYGISREVFVKDSTKSISLPLLMTGMIHGLFNKHTLMTMEEASNTAQRLLQQLKDANYIDNIKAGEEFLANNAKQPGVMMLPCGVQYKVLRKGTGPKPAGEESTVTVNYEGRLIDGTVFDSSVEHDGSVSLRLNQVISGWTCALLEMPEGSKWEIYIPQELAYGNKSVGNGIQPFSTLIFTVELLSIED